MDKVIIDGVDVSGCVCFATAQGVATVNGILVKDIDNACTVKQKPCEDIKNCMFKKQYKQLKRLQHYQAEFEHELMNDYTYDGYISPNGFTPIDVIKHIKSELKRLQAENERLKEENEKTEETAISLLNIQNELAKSCVIYKQTLQEIREIADIIANANCNYVIEAGNIIKKINEVIGEK